MFDSGVGGLTVLHECLVSLPRGGLRLSRRHGDVPLRRPGPGGCASGSAAIAELLLGGGAKLLVIACNTATSIGADVAREVAAEHGVEVVPVVEPQAEIAAAITDSGRVGVLATPNTVASGAYRQALEGAGPGARGDRGRGARPGAVHPGRLALRRGGGGDGPCLLRAVEAGGGRHPDPRLHPLPAGGADAAADPRPRRAPGQRRPRGRGRRPAHARVGRPRPRPGGEGDYRFLCTGEVESFRELGTRFLQMPWEVERVDISPMISPVLPAGILNLPTQIRPMREFRFWRGLIGMTTKTLSNTVYTHPVAKVMISIPDDLLERLDVQARANRVTRSGFLRRLVEPELKVRRDRGTPRRVGSAALLPPSLPAGVDWVNPFAKIANRTDHAVAGCRRLDCYQGPLTNVSLTAARTICASIMSTPVAALDLTFYEVANVVGARERRERDAVE